MTQYRYRQLRRDEDNAGERLIAEKALRVFSKRLGLRNVALNFIKDDDRGEICVNESIGGCTDGQSIFVLRGLPPRDLVRVVAHECRHVYQRKQGRPRAADDKERDARLFEYESDIPPDNRVIRWLLELDFEPIPQIAKREAPPKCSTAIGERIDYIKKLLARLPESPQYANQRANLASELKERLQQQQ